MRRRQTLSALVAACLAIAVVGCSGQNAESCAGLQREFKDLSVKTQDAVQTWQKIEDLQKAVTRMEQIKAKLAADCSEAS